MDPLNGLDQLMSKITLFLSEALKDLTLTKYRQIFHQWLFITEAIRRTRDYEVGLDSALGLLRFTEEHRGELSQSEYEDNLRWIYSFILDNLDRADHWKEYIQVWDQIRKNVDFSIEYSKGRLWTKRDYRPFVVRENRDTISLHFLFFLEHRRQVILRKLARKKAGRKLGNQFHHPQSWLTESEIESRLEQVKKWAHLQRTYRDGF